VESGEFFLILYMEKGTIKEKSFKFAVEIINLYKQLNEQREFVLSKQILRSGTSIGANVQEAQQAQSKPDFISKMSIALKEAQETEYWLLLFKESKLAQFDYEYYLILIDELKRMLISIIKTSKENLTKK
jgi:four helix bundle protein